MKLKRKKRKKRIRIFRVHISRSVAHEDKERNLHQFRNLHSCLLHLSYLFSTLTFILFFQFCSYFPKTKANTRDRMNAINGLHCVCLLSCWINFISSSFVIISFIPHSFSLLFFLSFFNNYRHKNK